MQNYFLFFAVITDFATILTNPSASSNSGSILILEIKFAL